MSPIKKNGSPRGSSHIQSLEGDLSQRKREEISLRQIMAKRGRLRYHCRLLPGSLSHTARLLLFRRAPSFSSRHSHVTLSLWPDTVYYIQIDLVTATSDVIQMRSAPLPIDIESRPLPAAPLIDRLPSSSSGSGSGSGSSIFLFLLALTTAIEIRRHRQGSMRLANSPSSSPPPPIRREPVGRQDSSTCRSFITENPIIRIIASPLLAILSSWYK